MRVYVSVGHDAEKKGAKSPFTNEYEYDILVNLTQYIWEELIDLGVEAEKVWSDKLGDAISEINGKARLEDIAIESHLNSFSNPSVKGCETLFFDGSKRGEKLARHVQDSLLAHLMPHDRGLLPRSDLAFLKNVRCTSIIVEPFFLSNKEEVNRFLMKDREANLRNVAFSIAMGIRSYVNSNR